MSIPLLVYYVLAKMMSVIESAPLGNDISDPLVSSGEYSDGDKLKNTLTIFRSDKSLKEIINTGNYEGYIFNQNRCIQFNNRILCGFDKNKGTQLDDYTMIDIGSGCRARGDRIECGYDNPPRIIRNLRHPDFKRVKPEEHRARNVPHVEHRAHDVPHVEHRAHDLPHGEHDASRGEHDASHGEHDASHGEHDASHREHDVPQHKHHHHRHHRNGDKLHNDLARQTPTRTAMTTDPTVPYTILESVENDYLENEILKSTFDKLVLKGEDTIIKSLKLTTASIKPINLATDAVKPVTTTTIKPIKPKSTLSPKRKTSQSTKATNTTLITEKITTVADSQMIKRMIEPALRKNLAIETSSDSPQVINTDNSKSDTTTISNGYRITVSPISKPHKKRYEENLETTCVEQGDRIVCYYFKKS